MSAKLATLLTRKRSTSSLPELNKSSFRLVITVQDYQFFFMSRSTMESSLFIPIDILFHENVIEETEMKKKIGGETKFAELR
jgi:hypothetical protein